MVRVYARPTRPRPLGRGLGDLVAVVALFLEAVGELGAALLGDAARDEHVHEVGLDVAQDARVVRDQQDAEAGVRLGAVDALGDDLERVDVEAGVGLVEHRELRLQQLELQDLVALLLAAREALVDVALGERRVHLEVRHRLAHVLDPAADRRRLAVDRGLGGAEEVRDGDAGDLDRVLHREEEAGAGALVDRHLEHVLAVEEDLALDDVVLRVAGDRVGERRLAGAVRAHDRRGSRPR